MADNKKETDIVSLLDIVPVEVSFTLPVNIMGIKFNKRFYARPFSLGDKIYFLHKYGEKEYQDKISDPASVEFELIHCEILHKLIKNPWPYKNFDKFLKNIIGFKKEVDILTAALRARGVSSKALMTDSEIKEAVEEIKKKIA